MPEDDPASSPAPRRAVVIGVDGSEESLDALVLGRLLAEVSAAAAVVCASFPYDREAMGDEAFESALEEDAGPLLSRAREALGSVETEVRAVGGQSPARALHDLAEREGAWAIVVGSTRRGGTGRVLPGSVGERLLNGAPCAVAVAPRGYADRAEHRLQRFAVGFDGSEEAWAAVRTAGRMAARVHASLRVVSVLEPLGYGFASSARILVSGGEYAESRRVEAERALGEVVDGLPQGLDATGRLLEGAAADTLVADAEQAGIDLLVVGSRAYGPMRRVLTGDAATRLLRTAPCPVLVLPRGAQAPV